MELQTENNLRLILDATPFPIAIVDLQDNIINYWSKSAITLFGHTASTTPEWYKMAYPDPDYRQDVINRWKPFLEKSRQSTQPVNTGEYRVTCRDGSVRICELYIQFLADQLVVTFNDITERKQSEILLQEKSEAIQMQNEEFLQINEEITQTNDELLRAKEQAEESEIRLRLAQTASKSGAWDWDIANNTFFWSDEFLEIFGMPKDTVAGFEAWTKALHPEDVESASQRIQESIDNKTELINDYRIIYPDGEIRWVRSYGTTYYEKDQPLRMIGLCIDITSQKSAELELIRARDRAEESDKLKTAFLANMSHEIRTPMNGILGFTELLKDPDLKGEEQDKYIKVIETSGARLLNIINDIISISKIESGQMEISISETHINDLLEFHYAFFKPEAEKKGLLLNVKKTLAAKDSTVKTDKEKVYAVLTNLIKNALKFTLMGSIEFGCDLVETNNYPSLLNFFVKDTGMGIPEEQKDIIFERFSKGADSLNKNQQGAGLGLSISKGYVELLGGQIWMESTPGKGSAFYFTIPVIVE